MKKIIAVILSAVMIFMLTSCGKKNDDSNASGGKDALEIYYLNFKPEIADIYKEIATAYEKETGVKVKVVTAASDSYETTLKSEIAKTDAPTIFHINGMGGYTAWKNYCLDLKDTKIYSYLLDKDMAIKDGNAIYGIPYVVEGFGIIYNNEIME